jgi:hypothetical protein
MAVLHGYWEQDGKRGREPGEERKEEGAWRPGASRGSFSSFIGKQEVATLAPAQDTREVAAYWKKKKRRFCRKPPRVWKIPGKNKNCTLCKIW